MQNKARHHDRSIAVSSLYSLDFRNALDSDPATIDPFQGMNEEEIAALNEEDRIFIRFLVFGTLQNREQIDELISKYSINRPIEKIDLVDRNILRVAFYQLAFSKDVHPAIVIDEAVKLSQELSNDVSFRFINGILDTARKDMEV